MEEKLQIQMITSFRSNIEDLQNSLKNMEKNVNKTLEFLKRIKNESISNNQ